MGNFSKYLDKMLKEDNAIDPNYEEGRKRGYKDAENNVAWGKNPYIKSAATPDNVQREKGWNRGFEDYLDYAESLKKLIKKYN